MKNVTNVTAFTDNAIALRCKTTNVNLDCKKNIKTNKIELDCKYHPKQMHSRAKLLSAFLLIAKLLCSRIAFWKKDVGRLIAKLRRYVCRCTIFQRQIGLTANVNKLRTAKSRYFSIRLPPQNKKSHVPRDVGGDALETSQPFWHCYYTPCAIKNQCFWAKKFWHILFALWRLSQRQPLTFVKMLQK